jgi:hypothetical protein
VQYSIVIRIVGSEEVGSAKVHAKVVEAVEGVEVVATSP